MRWILNKGIFVQEYSLSTKCSNTIFFQINILLLGYQEFGSKFLNILELAALNLLYPIYFSLSHYMCMYLIFKAKCLCS